MKRSKIALGAGLWLGRPGVPVVLGVSDTLGPVRGGANVTLTGKGFTGATGATFGGAALTSFAVVNDTTITGKTGAHAAGVVDVVVAGPGGDSIGGTGLYEYWNPSVVGASNTGLWHAEDGVVLDTGIKIWTNQGSIGPNHDWLNLTAAQQPAHVANVQNGMHAVRFDGTNDYFGLCDDIGNTVAESSLLSSTYTFAAVFKTNTTNANGSDTQPSLYSNTGSFLHYSFSSSGPTSIARQWDGAVSGEVAGAITTGAVYAAMWWYDGTNLFNQIGNAAPSQTPVGTEANFGFQPQLGSNYNKTFFFNGDLHEFITFNAAISGANLAKLMKYMQTGWAL